MNNITVWGDPKEAVRCELERDRMNADRDDVKIVDRTDGFIALAR